MQFLPSCHSLERSCLLPSPQRCAYWLGSMHQLPLASRVSSSRHCTFKTRKLTKALEHLWNTSRAPLEHLRFNLRSNSMIDVSITILTLWFVSSTLRCLLISASKTPMDPTKSDTSRTPFPSWCRRQSFRTSHLCELPTSASADTRMTYTRLAHNSAHNIIRYTHT